MKEDGGHKYLVLLKVVRALGTDTDRVAIRADALTTDQDVAAAIPGNGKSQN